MFVGTCVGRSGVHQLQQENSVKNYPLGQTLFLTSCVSHSCVSQISVMKKTVDEWTSEMDWTLMGEWVVDQRKSISAWLLWRSNERATILENDSRLWCCRTWANMEADLWFFYKEFTRSSMRLAWTTSSFSVVLLEVLIYRLLWMSSVDEIVSHKRG